MNSQRSRAALKLAGLLLAASLAAPLCAYGESPAQCTRAWDELKKAQTAAADGYKAFMIACLQNRVSPTTPRIDRPPGAPAQATARCRDGLYSYSTDPAAACAQHRGLQALLR